MRRTRGVGLSLAVSALTVSAIGGIAAAADEQPEITPAFRDHITQGLTQLARGSDEPAAPEKSTSAEIRESHEANDGEVSAREARALAAEAAPALAGGDPIVPPADQIARALGPNALQLVGEGGKPGGVMISDIPLAVPAPAAKDGGDWQPADLTFEAQGSRFVVTRSLVPTSVPNDADGTFRVGALGVRLAPAGSESTATSYDTSVVHPNIDDSTDLATRSVGAGLKFGWVLRSPDASQTQHAKLDLPVGAKAALVDGGAVRITNAEGTQIGTVSPAAATDADGISVPIEASLENDTVSYRLKTDLVKLKTPVVIDPEMLYEWGTGDTDVLGWQWNQNATPFSGTIIAGDGMRIKGAVGTGYAAQTWGGYIHWAPGDDTYGSLSPVSNQIVSPEHGFIWKAEFGGLNYTLNSPYSYQDPNVNIGVLSSTDVYHPPVQRNQKQNATGGWNAPVAGNLRQIPAGTLGATYRVYVGTDSTAPPTSLTLAKSDSVFSAVLYDFGLYGAGNVARPASEMRVAWTKLWASDNYDPSMANITAPSGWVSESYALPVLATDRGTGIEKVEFYSQGATPQMYGPGVAKTCVATGKVLCPFTFNDTVPVAPLPEGTGTYDVRATDGGGRKATKPVTLKVDKSAPQRTLAGTLWDARDSIPVDENDDGDYGLLSEDGALHVEAADSGSGVASIEILVDGQRLAADDRVDAQCTAAGCPTSMSADFVLPFADVAAGLRAISVVVRDQVADPAGQSDNTHTRVENFNVYFATDPNTPDGPEDGVGPDDDPAPDSLAPGLSQPDATNGLPNSLLPPQGNFAFAADPSAAAQQVLASAAADPGSDLARVLGGSSYSVEDVGEIGNGTNPDGSPNITGSIVMIRLANPRAIDQVVGCSAPAASGSRHRFLARLAASRLSELLIEIDGATGAPTCISPGPRAEAASFEPVPGQAPLASTPSE